MTRNPREYAQAYVEYGLLVAVAVVAFLIGLTALTGGASTYMAHAEPTPNATVLANLPNHVVSMNVSCAPQPNPFYTGMPLDCSLRIQDITTLEPGTLPTGSIAFTSAADGAFSPCNLTGTGVISGCSFQYTPTNVGPQDIIATYIPTSSHQSRTEPPQPGGGQFVGAAKDQTATTISCPTPGPGVPVGEPAQCTVQVMDLYQGSPGHPGRAGPVPLEPGFDVQVAATGQGRFSDVSQLPSSVVSSNPSYLCATDAALACGTLFRSDAVTTAVGQSHTIAASFAGTADYYPSDTSSAPPVVVSVAGPTPHKVSVDVQCSRGGAQQPLRIDQRDAATCTATVTDVNPPSVGNPTSVRNPTSITPTGTISWSSSAGSGGAGGLSSNACTLVRLREDVAQCQVTYTPTALGTPPGPSHVGIHHIDLSYSADWIHPDLNDLQGSIDLNVTDQHPVKVDVSCTPAPATGATRQAPLLIQGASADSTLCTVTVTDIALNGTPATPTGTIDWGLSANGGKGTFTPSGPCQLQPVNSATATCQQPVNYQPTVRGAPDGLPDQESTHTLVATYSSDWLHPNIGNDLVGSANELVANYHAAQVKVTCSPPTTPQQPLLVGPPFTTTNCTVTVIDPDTTPVTPTGTVTWSNTSSGAGGTGTFSPSASCQLQRVDSASAKCQPAVTYQPTARGAADPVDMNNTHNIIATYSGDGLHPADNAPQTATTPVYVHN